MSMKNQKRHKPGRPKVCIDDEQLQHLYLMQNLSTRDIGEKLGVSHQTIARRLSEFNIPAKRWQVPINN